MNDSCDYESWDYDWHYCKYKNVEINPSECIGCQYKNIPKSKNKLKLTFNKDVWVNRIFWCGLWFIAGYMLAIITF